MNFESLNKAAQEKQDELRVKKEKEEQLQKEMVEREITAFVNYVVAYLTPYVEETANDVIRHNGAKREKYVHVNDIIFGYQKTPYIRNRYKSMYDEPIYLFLQFVHTSILKAFQDKLPAFQMDLFCWRESGFFRADHQIRITMQFKKDS